MSKVSFGLVDPYLNEALVWRDKPNSKLQARCWRQQELRKQDYNCFLQLKSIPVFHSKSIPFD